jgi:pimeloyl-ACP methyl ester carboxylesterase
MAQISGPAGFLHIDDGGSDGVPVVFVHSFGGSTAHWTAQLAHLRKTRRAVALDLRGHGQSASPAGDDYAVESLAGDIAAVADVLKFQRFVLVGHSIGGAVSLAYSGEHPERVAGLVLVGTPGKMPAGQARQVMSSLKSDYKNVMEGYWNRLLTNAQPRVVAQIQSERERMPRDVSLSLIQATFDYDPVPALQRYRGPKMAVITPGHTQPYDLHNLAPDLPHKVVTGTGHWLHMDKPEEFNRILDEFLEGAVRNNE